MKTAHMLLLCMLGAALVSTVVCQGTSNPKECCFEFYPRRIKKDLIRAYYTTENRCPKTAIVLETVKSHRICVDPAAPWVQSVMKTLDESSV